MFVHVKTNMLMNTYYHTHQIYMCDLFFLFYFFVFRAVTDSINQLITLCTQQAPGQKECDNALRELEVNKTYPPCDGAGTFLTGSFLIADLRVVLLICLSGCKRNAGQPQRAGQ